MKYLLVLLFAVSLTGDIDEIAKVNALKKKAKEAYTKGDYATALKHYQYLTDSLQIKDDNIWLNLANAQYQLKDTANAVNNYTSLLSSKDKSVKSVAHQQLGIMKNRQKAFKEALDHFKEALKANPANEDARYNYELLKKVLKEQEQQQKDQQDQNKEQNQDKKEQEKQDQQQKDQEQKNKEGEENKDQESKDQQEQKDKEGKEKEEKEQQEKQDKEGEEEKQSEEKKPEQSEEEKENAENQEPTLSDKLKDMKISEDKAKMILEALKNNEIQYYQQNKRKPTKKRDSSKPDW